MMREKFSFLPSTETKGSDLKPLTDEELRIRNTLISQTVGLMGIHKGEAQRREDRAMSTMTSTIGAAPDKHAVLWQYEKDHLLAGENWESAKEALRSYRDGAGNQRIMVTDFLGSYQSQNRGAAQIEGLVNPSASFSRAQKFVKLGTVFLGDARFVPLRPQPPRLPRIGIGPKARANTVYVIGRIVNGALQQDENHTGAHFVRLPNSNTYVRRFVTRGLNHSDVSNISRASPLTSAHKTVNAQAREIKDVSARQGTRHNVGAGTVLTEQQQILSHTRGWQKRYISTGVSSRPAFSTRGTQFMSLYGAAVIDLADLDLTAVFDIHSPIAVKNTMGSDWDAGKVVSAVGPGNGATTFKGEEFLALRDVLRTRELLIKFTVPLEAVHYVPDEVRILGFGSTERDVIMGNRKSGTVSLLTRLGNEYAAGMSMVRGSEETPYKSINGRYWLFVLFDSKVAMDSFARGFPAWPDRLSLLFLPHCKMPDSLPGWK